VNNLRFSVQVRHRLQLHSYYGDEEASW
jgi:hypothetical protein